MKRAPLFFAFLSALLFLNAPAKAQQVNLYCFTNVAPVFWAPCSSSTPLPISGSFSATLSPFTPSTSGARGTPLTVTTSDSSGTLPTGAAVTVGNVGTNPMYCNVNGVAATTSDQLITASGGTFEFGVPAGTTALHCIATGGNTTANMVGGTGLAAMTGGGTSGGGGGGTSSNFGATFPTVGTAIGVKVGANMVNLVADGSGNLGVVSTQGGSLLSNTNGIYTNVLQGNTALSATNGLYTNLLQGNAALSSGNPLFASVAPTAIATWGLMVGTTPNTAPTNTLITGGIYNTSAPAPSTGQTLPFQLDASGNLNVNIKAGAGSGGTALQDEGTFTQGTTNFTPSGCFFANSITNLTTGQGGSFQCTNDRNLFINLNKIAGAAPSLTNPLWTAAAQATVAAGNTLNAVTGNSTGTSISVAGYGAALFNVNCSVNCSGGTQINFQASDIVGFQAVGAMPVAGGSAMVTNVINQSGAAMFCVPNFGYSNMRATASNYSAGTISVTITPINTSGCDPVQVANAIASVGNNGDAVSATASCCSPVFGYNGVFNGTTWDRMRSGAATGSVLVDYGSTSDACSPSHSKLGAPINLTASGQIIPGTASKKTYICSIDIISATAQNIALVEGTGTTCATNIFGLAGGTTAATGWNFAANGGITKGGGFGTVYFGSGDANATAANVCLLLSSTGQTSGEVTYVQQ